MGGVISWTQQHGQKAEEYSENLKTKVRSLVKLVHTHENSVGDVTFCTNTMTKNASTWSWVRG